MCVRLWTLQAVSFTYLWHVEDGNNADEENEFQGQIKILKSVRVGGCRSDVRRNGEEKKQGGYPPRNQRAELVKLVRPIHTHAQSHSEEVQPEKDL